jgi:hypothetical protein
MGDNVSVIIMIVIMIEHHQQAMSQRSETSLEVLPNKGAQEKRGGKEEETAAASSLPVGLIAVVSVHCRQEGKNKTNLNIMNNV